MFSPLVQSLFRPRALFGPRIGRPARLPLVDATGRCLRCGKIRRSHSPRDRQRRGPVAMASGDILLDTSGNYLKSDGGTCPGNSGDQMESNGSGDSCYCSTPPPPNPCFPCSKAQSNLTCIISGTTALTNCCCFFTNVGSGSAVTYPATNGTYCLTSSSFCYWTATIPFVGYLSTWSQPSTCTGTETRDNFSTQILGFLISGPTGTFSFGSISASQSSTLFCNGGVSTLVYSIDSAPCAGIATLCRYPLTATISWGC